MGGAAANFIKTVQRFDFILNILPGDSRHSDDRIHGRTDIMAHLRQKSAFRLISSMRRHQSFLQFLLLFHLTAALIINKTRHQDCLLFFRTAVIRQI